MANTEGMAKVLEGFLQFSSEVYQEHRELFDSLKNQQNPQVLFITCADSRIDPTLITRADPGELFICRNIGNIVPAYGEMLGGVSAVVEYAVSALKVTDILVCGHSDCGAMKALRDPESAQLASMPTVQSWLRNAHAALSVVRARHPEADGDRLTHLLVEENVLLQLQHLRTHPPVAAGLAAGTLRLHGCVYNIGSGHMDLYSETEQRFRAVGPLPAAETDHDGVRATEPVHQHPGPAAVETAKAG